MLNVYLFSETVSLMVVKSVMRKMELNQTK